jgi:UPF0755 protein
MKKLLVTLLVAILVAGGAGYLMLSRVRQPYQAWTGPEQFVDIPPGAGTRAIGDKLIAAGVMPDTLTFRAGLWITGQARRLKAGEYRFDHPMTPVDVIDKIARGDVYVINVTFPEGLTIAEMAAIFEKHALGRADEFVQAARDASPMRALDREATDLEGYLFPDTYPLSRHTPAATLVHLMAARFENVLTPAIRQGAAARGLTVRQLVTMASIVEKETGRAEERPVVAAVYGNRVRIGMPLQCDPTLIFALARAGKYTGNLRREDLAFDSPYNTYRYRGLPPGPIASPGLASIEAVLNPSPDPYLYFVSRNDGSHVFAGTLDEHNRNVQKWQVQYFREKRRAK